MKNKGPFERLLCNIIDKFLVLEFYSLLDKNVEIDNFEQYCHSATNLLYITPTVF